MEITTSEKGKSVACFEGHTYHKKSQTQSCIYWVCTKLYKKKCPGKMKCSTSMESPVNYQDHNHGSDEAAVELAKTNTWIKERAVKTLENPVQIYSQAISMVRSVYILLIVTFYYNIHLFGHLWWREGIMLSYWIIPLFISHMWGCGFVETW